MHERTFNILEAAIREFIETGEPVSSGTLFNKYDFGIRPAMIRAELSWLTDQGYLEQPYHSAGRVPSNRGYDFFAARALAAGKPQSPRTMEEMLREGDYEGFLSRLSEELGVAGAIGTREEVVGKNGLEPLMENLAWDSREEVMQVVRDFEALEERLSRVERMFTEDFLDVFIGRKSPVTKSNELAVIAGDYNFGEGRVFLFAIGPKRMDYERAVALLKGLKQISNF